MNDPAFIAKGASGVVGRTSGPPCFLMPCRSLRRRHGGLRARRKPCREFSGASPARQTVQSQPLSAGNRSAIRW
jgi:hypothetical protein